MLERFFYTVKTTFSDNKNMKTKKRNFKLSKLQLVLLITVLAVILIVGGALTAVSIASYKPTIAFYNVSEKVQATLQKEMETLPSKHAAKKSKSKKSVTSPNYNYVVLESSIPLSKQRKILKKANLVFATLDCDIKEFAQNDKLIFPQNFKLLEGTPSTTRQTAVTSDSNLLAVPLLYDFYEIDINMPAYRESGIESIDVWSDLENFFDKTKTDDGNFVFAGKLDSEFISFVGCLTEALSGTEALEEAVNKLYAAAKKENVKYIEEVTAELCEEGAPLYEAVTRIKSLDESKYLHRSWSDFQLSDTLFFMENHLVNTAFYKLSDHRNIDQKVINEFTSIYMPGKTTNSDRTFSSPTIVGLSLSKDKYTNEALTLLATSHQSNLSFSSGLAPVSANCGIPDKQADDVRFWIAASAGPNLPLSAALPSDEMKKAVAEVLKNKIKF